MNFRAIDASNGSLGTVRATECPSTEIALASLLRGGRPENLPVIPNAMATPGKRGKDWSDEENMLLARSVVHVSHNPVTGTDQTAKMFWQKTCAQFQGLLPNSKRSSCSIENRWKKFIQPRVSKFCGYFSTVTALEKSGFKEEDYVRAAITMFEEIENETFDLRLLWEYLRKEVPKFEDSLLSSPTPTVNSRTKRKRDDIQPIDIQDLINREGIDEVKDGVRSTTGNKKAKDLHIASESKSRFRKAMQDDAEARTRLISQQNEIAAKYNQIQEQKNLFTLFASRNDAMSERFFDLQRRLTLHKLEEAARQAGLNCGESTVSCDDAL